MRYLDTVRYLYSLGNEVLTAKLGLQNITVLLDYLGNPQRKYKAILIAGTNGKGSVAAYTESILRASGLRTGLYTSPHLVELRERVRVDQRWISEQDFSRLIQTVKEAVALLLDSDRLGKPRLERHPTFFEMVTAVAFLYFEEKEIDVAVTEVGLGGRYDATNVLDPIVAVITNVDLDHQQYLGQTIAEIAFEKAGIIKSRTYEKGELIVAAGSNHVTTAELIEDTCRSVGARLLPSWKTLDFSVIPDSAGRYSLELESRIRASLPLPGHHQVENALLAIQAARACSWVEPMAPKVIQTGLESTRWPGRLEIREGAQTFILDGAHNPAGARCLREYCERFLAGKTLVMIFAAMADKDIDEIGRTLFPLAAKIVLTRTKSERCADPRVVAGLLPTFAERYLFANTVDDAVILAKQTASSGEIILGFGSLFLIGEISQVLDSTDYFVKNIQNQLSMKQEEFN